METTTPKGYNLTKGTIPINDLYVVSQFQNFVSI